MRLLSLLLILSLYFMSPTTVVAESIDAVNSSSTAHESSSVTQPILQVNINTASAEELAKSLNGIGINKAKKIVEYREKMGPFIAIEQLKEVSGIGQSILDKNAGKIKF